MKLTPSQRRIVIACTAQIFARESERPVKAVCERRSSVRGLRITLRDEAGEVLRIYRVGGKLKPGERMIPDEGDYV